jgi:hypothetical protein
MPNNKLKQAVDRDKSNRANASQFIVAGELCRRDWVALVTVGNTPNTDILCSNKAGTRFVHIQVKTYVPGNKTVSVGKKAERDYGRNFLWVLGGIQPPEVDAPHEFYIIPSADVPKNVFQAHQKWLSELGKKGQERKDSNVRTIHLPPYKSVSGWDISKYRNRWDIVDELLRG